MRMIDKLHNILADAEKAIKAPAIKRKVKQGYLTCEGKATEMLLDAHLALQKIRTRIAQGETEAFKELRLAKIKVRECEAELRDWVEEREIMFVKDADEVQKEFEALVAKITKDEDEPAPPSS